MKKTLLLFALLVAALSARADVTIDAAHFPDANFRALLLSEYPNGYITTAELDRRRVLHASELNISDLTGVAYFSNLTDLYCYNNNLTSLPTLPHRLEELQCSGNKLTSLSGISSCASTLKSIRCGENSFTSVNISDMTALEELSFMNSTELTDITCQNNPQLLYIGCDGCTKLTSLYCPNNNLDNISLKDCTALKTLKCYNNSIRYIHNLGSCTSLTFLDCKNNKIGGFDVLPASLQEIDCSYNKLYTLPSLPGSLQKLYCDNNLTIYSLPTLPSSLKELGCSHNLLTSLPTLPSSLKWLDCHENQLTALPTLPDNIELADCSSNNIAGNVWVSNFTKLITLDVSSNPSITLLSVGNDLALTDLGIRGCIGLKTLSMSNVPSYDFSNLTLPSALEQFSCDKNNLTTLPELPESLKTLYCYDNQLTALPALPATIETVVAEKNRFTTLKINEKANLKNLYVGNNPLLTELNCSYNALSALDISGCTALKTLYCNDNQLTSLNVQGFAALETVYCGGNQLTSLSLQGCNALEKVYCGNNQLTSLSLQGCNALTLVNCCRNQIKDSEMTAMIGSLRAMPNGTQGTLQVLWSAGEGNTITNEQVRAARNKGWIPYKWSFRDFFEIPVEDEVPGDLDGSGNVDVDDLNLIINMMLDKADKTDAADLNGDGNVDVDDLNAIINIILGKD